MDTMFLFSLNPVSFPTARAYEKKSWPGVCSVQWYPYAGVRTRPSQARLLVDQQSGNVGEASSSNHISPRLLGVHRRFGCPPILSTRISQADSWLPALSTTLLFYPLCDIVFLSSLAHFPLRVHHRPLPALGRRH